MPDFNGTGPSGKGPLTGRKRGKCRGSLSEKNKEEDDKGLGRRVGFQSGRRHNGGGRRNGDMAVQAEGQEDKC